MPRDAEVHDVHPPVLVDEDILRLQVTVDHLQTVRFGQAPAHLSGHGDQLCQIERPRPPEQAHQIFARDELHRDVVESLVFADVINPTDVGMGDAAG